MITSTREEGGGYGVTKITKSTLIMYFGDDCQLVFGSIFFGGGLYGEVRYGCAVEL